ncbi:conserved unknown protein [Ectocarpus siliculosus]|uniref:monodehydroascorbate reductase (NADH) n=1 Tax=Ectocarpus siliculosus TaxID=2880 RepID=D7FZW4_ECTSI|nr:conserved unknown protein [Ectocarpus siliculosus]|eukprot:CBJ48589.1 conserved unknown protein [Ectocarpus siliculosus]
MASEQMFDMVCLGGGVSAGYWAEEVVSLLKSGAEQPGFNRPKLCVVTGYPDGLVPYERSEMSKECLRPENNHSRDWQAWGNKVFPFTSTGNDRERRNARWYRDNGVTVLSSCECYEVDVANATLRLYQPKRLQGDQDSACFCVRHSDLRGPKLDKPEAYGLGSAHYLRDVGDCIKLVKALSTVPSGGGAGGGTGDANTVALVGGGVLCMEVAAAIVTHYPGVRPILLMSGSRLMPDFFNQEMSDFYEEKLKQAGVRLEKNVTAERLWGLEEQGEFDTLGGRRVHFGPAPRGFTECRGVVLRNTEDCLIHVPARSVIIGIGAVPNSELFRGKLEMSEDGGVLVDAQCRTAVQPPSEDGGGGGIDVGSAAPPRPIYAAGDVAAFPLALEGFAPVRHEHIQNARDMAICAARNMVGSSAWGSLVSSAGEAGFQKDYYGGGELPMYQPVPGFSSRFLGLSWRFYGVAEGEVVVLGAAEFRTTRTFGAFWVRKERVVGAFLEGGTIEQQIAVAQVTRLRPKVFSSQLLKGSQLGDFLEDPGSIEASDETDLSQLLMCCRCV